VPTAAPRDGTDARITAARGETEPFQIAISAVGGDLTGATVRLSDLVGPGHATIASRALVRYRENFVHIDRHSPDYGGPTLKRHWFPDALIPFVDPATGKPPTRGRYPASPFPVEAGHTQPVWVDVTVPRDARAGRYSGRWTVTSDQGRASGTLSVLVRDFTLPVQPAEYSEFEIERGENQTKAVDRLLLRYGLQPDPAKPSWEGALHPHGLESANLGFWSGAYYGHCKMSPPPAEAVLRKAVEAQLPSIRVYNYTADEISKCPNLYPRVRTWARRLHAAGSEQLITMVPTRQVLDDGTGHLAVDIFTLLPEQFKSLDPQLYEAVLDGSGEFWSYQALVQGKHTPSWEIDFPGANYRILPGFLNARMGVRGVLYWAVDYWRHDPWRNIEYRCCYPGEGLLVYPGKPAGVEGVVPSIRLAWIRAGIDDYGYVQKLRDLGAGAQAQQIIDTAAHSWSQWTQSGAVLDQVRNRLALAIEHAEASQTSPRGVTNFPSSWQELPSESAKMFEV
jgi:hypothetical protein